jgi:hypothetical protein
MHGPINVKSPNNINKWQMGFNSAFEGLRKIERMNNYMEGGRGQFEDTTLLFRLSSAHIQESNECRNSNTREQRRNDTHILASSRYILANRML